MTKQSFNNAMLFIGMATVMATLSAYFLGERADIAIVIAFCGAVSLAAIWYNSEKFGQELDAFFGYLKPDYRPFFFHHITAKIRPDLFKFLINYYVDNTTDEDFLRTTHAVIKSEKVKQSDEVKKYALTKIEDKLVDWMEKALERGRTASDGLIRNENISFWIVNDVFNLLHDRLIEDEFYYKHCEFWEKVAETWFKTCKKYDELVIFMQMCREHNAQSALHRFWALLLADKEMASVVVSMIGDQDIELDKYMLEMYSKHVLQQTKVLAEKN